MMGYGYGMMGGLGMIIPTILIGLVIYAVVKLSQHSGGNNSSQRDGNAALDILKQRYANGEISEEEYIQKKKILRD